MKTLLLIDLDGVMFDNSHRAHLLPTGDGATADQWEAFNKACRDDAPIIHMWEIARLIGNILAESGQDRETIFLTGRAEHCRQETVAAITDVILTLDADCLWDRDQIQQEVSEQLVMRADDDHRPGHEVKRGYIEALRRKLRTTTTPDGDSVLLEDRIILIDDDQRIIDACAPLVSQAIHVQPFTGCAALPGVDRSPKLRFPADWGSRLRRTYAAAHGSPFQQGGPATLAQLREQIFQAPFFVLPEGYKMVPITPTPEMMAAGQELEYFEGGYGRSCDDFWQEMINVAPTPKQVFESNVPTTSLSQAAQAVLAERRRQVEEEGFTPDHDDQYREHELRDAAACYASTIETFRPGEPPRLWPWSKESWKPHEDDMRVNLVKAGALILAAIEQIDRRHEWDDQDRCKKCGDKDWFTGQHCEGKMKPEGGK